MVGLRFRQKWFRFQVCFQGKSEQQVPWLHNNVENPLRNSEKKRFPWKDAVCNENDGFEIADVEHLNQKSLKTWHRNRFKNKLFWTRKTDINRATNHSKIDQNPVIRNFVSILLLSWSSRVVPRCQNGLPRCSRTSVMASQDAPEVPTSLSKVLLGCQNGSQDVKKEAPRLSNGLQWRSREAKADRISGGQQQRA